MFSVKFWGVRGSIPCPGRNTVVYGGNTTCIEIRAGKKLVIIDFGSGIKDLSEYLMKHDMKDGGVNADVFVTHTHMDHLIGFPMFLPLFFKSSNIRIYGPILPGELSLYSVFSNEIAYEYWPIKLNELSAKIVFKQLRETVLDLGGGLKVRTKFTNHTLITMGFRFEYKGKSIVTFFDAEPFWNIFQDSDKSFYGEDASLQGALAVRNEEGTVRDFFKDADVLIHDCQYLEDEYKESRLNWGHSNYKYAIDSAGESNVKKLLLFHHDPMRSDKELLKIEKSIAAKYKPRKGMKVLVAKEGMVVEA